MSLHSGLSLLEFTYVCGILLILWLIQHFVRQSSLRNIPGPASDSFFTGNLRQLFDKKNGKAFFDHLARDYQKVVKLHGNFGTNQLFVYDPLALHHIVVKDQHIYPPPEHFLQGIKIIGGGGNGLVSSMGEMHRNQRKLLAPAFSAAAIRNMCPIFYGTAHKLQAAIRARVENSASEIDISHWMSRTALQLIGEGGLGHSFDNLTEDHPVDDYARVLKSLPVLYFPLSIARRFLPLAMRIGTPEFRRFMVDVAPWPALHKLRDALDEQYKHTAGILKAKKQVLSEGDAALSKQVGQGKDLMSILLRENMDASEENQMREDDVHAQMSVLTFAATDTTSSALARVLHLLAQYPKAQQTLREELLDARAKLDGRDIPYDELSALPYLDAICRETLRLYPPVPYRERTTVIDTVLPLSEPIIGLNGKEMHEIHVPKGTSIIVGISACNRDSDIWGPDSDEWKPERWLAPLPASVAAAHIPGIYSNLLTFFGGKRSCIGFKFSQLEMKVVLAIMVSSFQFELPVEKHIVWNFGSITYPSIVGDEGPAKMILQVTSLA